MFNCRGPVWQGDDFSECVKDDYFLILLPVIACSISFVLAAYQAAAFSLDTTAKGGYLPVPQANGHASGSGNGRANSRQGQRHQRRVDRREEDDEEEDEDDIGAHEQLTIEVNKPRWEVGVLSVEILAIAGQVAVHIATFVTGSYHQHSFDAQLTRIATWIYILFLGTLRLLFTIRRVNTSSKLWYHTAFLYLIQFFFSFWIFRGDLIAEISRTRLILTSTDFALSTLLILVAISVRRGNRVVTLVHDEKLRPSPEPMASLLSLASFSWVDGLIYLGYKRPLEFSDVYDLIPTAKARKVVSDLKSITQATRLTWRLFLLFKWDLVFQFCWTGFSAVSEFVPTLLIKAILEYVENPQSLSPSMAWLYVIGMLIFGMNNGVAEGLALWRGREICIKLRALLVSEVYRKTLRRKSGISDDTEKSSEGEDASSKQESKDSTWRARITRLFRSEKPPEQAKHASSGQIINLMSVDAFKVSEVCSYLHFLFPRVWIEFVLAVTLLWRLLGWSSIASLIILALLVPYNTWITRQFQKAQKRILACTDARISTTNEVLNNVRIVKFFAWEEKYMGAVSEKRGDELKAMRYRFGIYTMAASFWAVTPVLITGFSFFLYTIVEGRPLVPSVAFTAMSLFSLLRYPLDRLTDGMARVLEAKVSVDRIEKYLNEDETGKYDQLRQNAPDNVDDGFLGFKKATCSWGQPDEPADVETPAFRMINMDIRFKKGGLNVIAGPTGSGKTSLLMALLGEMNLISGSVHLPGGYVREKLTPDLDGLTESVAYCAQQAWLVNDTIKQNILFASPLDSARYEAVIDACALRKDLEVLEAGDATLVGEKGIVVSGGQKQRISLARALYCNARYVLLDDCLSAVDSHTAQHLFDECINGPMMAKRTCILVTHNLSLTVFGAKHVVLLDNGKVKAQGTPDKLKKSGVLGDAKDSRPGTRPPSRAGSNGGSGEAEAAQNGRPNGNKQNGQASQPKQADSKAFQDDVEDANRRMEAKSEGAIALGVIKLYFSSMGNWIFPVGIVGSYIASNIGNIATNVWIRQWSNSYQTRGAGLVVQNSDANLAYQTQSTSDPDINLSQTWAMMTGRFMWFLPDAHSNAIQSQRNTGYVSTQASSNPDNGYYLGVYATLGVVFAILSTAQFLFLFAGSLRASKSLHGRLLEAVLRAKFKFFDTTPLGQIMNRFSKDLQAIDLDIAAIAASVLQCMVGVLTTVILISVVTPKFLIAAVFLAFLYVAVGLFYVSSSRDLKRLESASRAPLYQQFGETISGITTIRAYGDEQRFIRDNASRVNQHNRPFIYLWATNRWLALRVQWAGAMVSFFAAMFILLSAGKIDAGAAGISLSYALTFNDSILWLVRLYAENEQNMNHVERVKQYLDIEQEAPAKIPARKPAGSWPDKGAIEFVDYTTSYRPDLEPVLKNLSVKIQGEEKIGIVGRTGAGKSSFALALFRGLEADSGKILVDGVDVGLIGLQDLRESITIVPQDPTLFTGTIRSNLDPFGLFTDEEIFNALRQVHLVGTASTMASGVATPATPSRLPAGSNEIVSVNDGLVTDEPALLYPVDDPGSVTADMSAHTGVAPPRLEVTASHSSEAVPTSGPDPNSLSKVLTNTRENVNMFKNLSSAVAESGTNLSQGQRQLLCLARALLKRPRVLVMDEATASIDYGTDAKIQKTLREVRGSTIVTIAHRLKTIADYDKVMVLDHGRVVEFGPPWELVEREADTGHFRALCESSGELDILLDTARRAGAMKGRLAVAEGSDQGGSGRGGEGDGDGPSTGAAGVAVEPAQSSGVQEHSSTLEVSGTDAQEYSSTIEVSRVETQEQVDDTQEQDSGNGGGNQDFGDSLWG